MGEEEREQERRLKEDLDEAPLWWHLEELGEWLAGKYPWENVADAELLISGRPPRLAEPPPQGLHEGRGDAGSSSYLPLA